MMTTHSMRYSPVVQRARFSREARARARILRYALQRMPPRVTSFLQIREAMSLLGEAQPPQKSDFLNLLRLEQTILLLRYKRRLGISPTPYLQQMPRMVFS